MILFTGNGYTVRDSDVTVVMSRSSGPGGQNVNKRKTRVCLRLDLTSAHLDAFVRKRLGELYRITNNNELVLCCDQFREQHRNYATVFARLRKMLQVASLRPKPRVATKVSPEAQRRRLEAKRRHGQKKRERRWESS